MSSWWCWRIGTRRRLRSWRGGWMSWRFSGGGWTGRGREWLMIGGRFRRVRLIYRRMWKMRLRSCRRLYTHGLTTTISLLNRAESCLTIFRMKMRSIQSRFRSLSQRAHKSSPTNKRTQSWANFTTRVTTKRERSSNRRWRQLRTGYFRWALRRTIWRRWGIGLRIWRRRRGCWRIWRGIWRNLGTVERCKMCQKW